MARLETIDDNERRKYEDYNRRTYGTNLDAASNDRRRRTTNTSRPTDSRPDTRTSSRTTTVPDGSAPRTTERRRPRRPRPTYRPSRKDKRIKASLPTAKKTVAFPVRWLVRIISLGLFIPQAFITLLVLLAFSSVELLDSNPFTRFFMDISGGIVEGTAALFWIIMISFGWIKVALIFIILKVSGAHPLYGTHSGTKVGLFIATLVLYSLPGLNLIPWCFVWAESVIRHPD